MFSRTYQPGMLCAGGQENKDACEGIVSNKKEKSNFKFCGTFVSLQTKIAKWKNLVFFSQVKTMSVKIYFFITKKKNAGHQVTGEIKINFSAKTMHEKSSGWARIASSCKNFY
jgi:hypothetical protein